MSRRRRHPGQRRTPRARRSDGGDSVTAVMMPRRSFESRELTEPAVPRGHRPHGGPFSVTPAKASVLLSAFILCISMVTIASSTPPAAPNPGSIASLGFNPAGSFVPMSVDSSGDLNVADPVGTLFPSIGTAPFNQITCKNVISSLSTPTVLVDVNFISPTSLPPGASLEIFDETTANCNTTGTPGATIVLSTGQIGAGYKLGSPITLSSGLSYQINTPGSFIFGTGYGIRFRTTP